MSTEPKLGRCDCNYDGGCGKDYPHVEHHGLCVNWREGESAAAQPCGECVTHVIAGASWINCALPKGHEGGHRGKGTCFKHGEYFGEVGTFPQCLKWPDCIVEAVPPAAETAMTAEQFANDYARRLEQGQYGAWTSCSAVRAALKACAEAYAEHLREAAQPEGIWAQQLEAAEKRTQLLLANQKRVSALITEAGVIPVNKEGKIVFTNERAETAERKLAELEKVLEEIVAQGCACMSADPGWHSDRCKLPKSQAALASLRAEHKEG